MLEPEEPRPTWTQHRWTRKAQAAVALKIGGRSYGEIAEILGYASVEKATQAVERELASGATDYEKKRARTMANASYELLKRSIMPKVMDTEGAEHLAAVSQFRGILAEQVRLNGAALPAEMILRSPTEGELDAWILGAQTEVMREQGVLDVEEVNVLSTTKPAALPPGEPVLPGTGGDDGGPDPDGPGAEGGDSPGPSSSWADEQL